MNAGNYWEQEYNRPNGLSVEKLQKATFTFTIILKEREFVGFGPIFLVKGFIYSYLNNTFITSKFHENRPVRAELFHADRELDGHDEATSRLSKFCERP